MAPKSQSHDGSPCAIRRRCEHPRRLAVADPQRDDALVVRPPGLEVAVGDVEDGQAPRGVDRRRRPHAAAAVVEHGAAVVDARLESPERVAGRQVGGDEVPAVAVLSVRRDPEQHAVPDHDGRGEDARLVVGGIGRRLGQAGVVVVPVLGAVRRPQRVQRVAAPEDHEVRSRAGPGLEPRARSDEAAVGARVAWELPRPGHDRGLRRDLEVPTQLPGDAVERVEVPVPRPHVHRRPDDDRVGGHGVTRREEPGRRERAGADLIEGGRRRERVLCGAAVGGPVPLPRRECGRRRVAGGGLGEVPDRRARDEDRRDQEQLEPSTAPHQLSPHDVRRARANVTDYCPSAPFVRSGRMHTGVGMARFGRALVVPLIAMLVVLVVPGAASAREGPAELRLVGRLLHRRTDHPRPGERSTRLPAIGPQLPAPRRGGAGREQLPGPELQRRRDRRHDQRPGRVAGPEPAAVRQPVRDHRARDRRHRRQRHRVLRHHAGTASRPRRRAIRARTTTS